MTAQLTFSLEEPPANPSQSQDFVRDWMTREEISHSPIYPSLISIGPSGWFGRTSPVSCLATEDGTLVPSSGRWAKSGMGSPTECLTLNTSEWPKDAAVCSLSDILETGDVPQRFFLSGVASGKQTIGTLMANAGTKLWLGNQEALSGDYHILQPIAFGAQNSTKQGDNVSTEVTPTLDKSKTPAIAFDPNQITSKTNRSQPKTDQMHTLPASSTPPALFAPQVRRLTPIECERLQGFPDDYTLIEYRNKPAADGPRYKAMGNSMAVPVMRWIGERIQAVTEVEKTLEWYVD